MLAIARPVARAEHVVRDLPETGACRACIQGLQRLKPVCELRVATGYRPGPGDGEDDSDPGLQAVIVGQVVMEEDRPRSGGTLDDVEPKRHAATVDHQALAELIADHANGLMGEVDFTSTAR